MSKTKDFKPAVCNDPDCGQTKEYLLGLDKGSAKIVIAMMEHIARTGKNDVHPAQEMDLSGDRKWFVTNLSRPRFHGLIAYLDKDRLPGRYCITRKGGKFLRNELVPKYAIISKVTGHQNGYFAEFELQTNLKELLHQEPMWEGDELRMINHIAGTEYQPPTLF